jgi:hypothetical protein
MLEQGICRLETIPTSRIDSAASEALSPWRRPLAVHDPGNIVLDLAIALALGGDCLADVNLLRAEPGVFGRVASDPTVSRLVDTLAADVDRALAAIKQAQATARQKVWALAGEYAPDHSTDASAPLIIDLDATLVTAHSEKEHAAPTFKRGFGFHPLLAFVDHGQAGTAEPLHLKLRPGTLDRTPPPTTSPSQEKALAQLPRHRPGRERMPRRRYTRRPPRATPGGWQQGWCRPTRSCRTLRAWLGSVPYEEVRPCSRPFAMVREAMITVVERPAGQDPGRVASPAPPRWWPTSRWRRWQRP